MVLELENFVSENEMMRGMLELEGLSLLDSYSELIFLLMAVSIAFPLTQTLYKLRTQEKRALLEHIFSRALSRKQGVLSFYLLALDSAVVSILLLAFGLYFSSFGAFDLVLLRKAKFVYLPALWVSLSLTLLLLGWKSAWLASIYLYLEYAFISVYVGKIVEIPSWIVALTPYGFIASYPAETRMILPQMGLLVFAIGTLIIGLRGYQRRGLLP